MPNSRPTPRWLPWIFLLIGLPFLLVAFLVWQNTRSFLAAALRADGVVTELQRSGKGYKPVVAYATLDGRQHTTTGKVSSSPPAYDVGEKVKVAYSSKDPADARIIGFFELHFVPVLFTFLGGLFTFFGVMFMFLRRSHLSAPGANRFSRLPTPDSEV